jgi:beta-lactamase regulating signal transducer with metallopeptidase domain
MTTLLIHGLSVLLLALLVELACRLGRFRPALCHALWLVVLLKLMVPPLVAWPVSSESLFAGLKTVSVPEQNGNSPARAGIAHVSRGISITDTGAGNEALISPAPATGPAQRLSPALPPMTIALGIWCAGALIFSGIGLWQIRRARRQLQEGRPLPGWQQAMLEETCRKIGVAIPRALELSSIDGIYMQAVGRPVLLVSSSSLESIEASRWNTIIVHELAHLKRRDHWVAWALFLARIVWWWNPLFWWIEKRVHLYSELACDAWVVSIHPDERRNYAESIVRVMALLSKRRAAAPVLGLAAWRAVSEERRLWMIMKSTSESRLPWAFGVMIGIVALVLSPAWLASGTDGKELGTVPVPAPKDNLAAGRVSDARPVFESEITGPDVFPAIESGVTEARPVELHGSEFAPRDDLPLLSPPVLRGVPVERSRDPLPTQPVETPDPRSAGRNDLRSVTVPSTGAEPSILPSTPMKPKSTPVTGWQLALTPNLGVADAMKSPVSIEFEKIYIGDILQYLQDSYELNFVLDQRRVAPFSTSEDPNAPRYDTGAPREFVTDGQVELANLRDVPLSDALEALGRTLNLHPYVRGHVVWLTAPAQMRKDAAIPLPTASFKEGPILERLSAPANIEFEHIHLQDLIVYLTEEFELNFVVDNRVVMPAGGDWNKPPIGSPGYHTDGIIQFIHLKDTSLGEVLHVVTRLLDISYTVEKNYVFISTPEFLTSTG